MSTRSRIGKLNPDGTILSVYCHFDGYFDGVGATLQNHYENPEKVDALLALGDISSLTSEIGEKHPFNDCPKDSTNFSFNDCPKDSTNFYGRDGGEDASAELSENVMDFMDLAEASDAEYVYLFDGKWKVLKGS